MRLDVTTPAGIFCGSFVSSNSMDPIRPAAQDLLKALVSEGQVSHEMGSVTHSTVPCFT